jgi:hypothetical protein
MPLLFWVGVFVLGMLPYRAKPLGGRKVKSICLIYDLNYEAFLLFVSRLILILIPRISRVPEKFEAFSNNSLIFFGFNSGPVENRFYNNLIKYFMRRYRKAVNSNCILRVYVNVLNVDGDVETRLSFGFKQLTAYRFPIFFKD